ncbi:MAG: hypothetical protein IH891_02370 [Planctomycetes bacterium]|nr:hypothetical protein [Planctomycetota bacterium]
MIPQQVLSDALKEKIAKRRVRSAVFTTYTFDPGFFELHILPLLFDAPFSQIETVKRLRLEDELRLPPREPRANSMLTKNIDDYIKGFTKRLGSGLSGALSRRDMRNYMEMLGIFQQLTPPTYLKLKGKQAPETLVASRTLGRELDLSAWFTRPCVIILGYLEDSPCPIPLRVDGKPPATAPGSLTIVRWIYPLPLDEAKVVHEGGPK